MKVKIKVPKIEYPLDEEESRELEEQGIYPGTMVGVETIEIELPDNTPIYRLIRE